MWLQSLWSLLCFEILKIHIIMSKMFFLRSNFTSVLSTLFFIQGVCHCLCWIKWQYVNLQFMALCVYVWFDEISFWYFENSGFQDLFPHAFRCTLFIYLLFQYYMNTFIIYLFISLFCIKLTAECIKWASQNMLIFLVYNLECNLI